MIDCHLHLQDPVFSDQLDKVVEETKLVGVEQLVVNGTCPGDWLLVEELASQVKGVIPFYGLHPWNVNECQEGWDSELRSYLEKYPSAGVGEIGLDKWIRDHDIKKQREVFLKQLELAQELKRPATIHCLRAWGHLQECLDQSDFDQPFLLHSFSGPAEFVSGFVERGAFFSISGYFFREDKATKLEAFKEVPEDRILLETDAPDMLPPVGLIRYPMRNVESGTDKNHPANLAGIYDAYADWSGISLADVVQRMKKNFAGWYRPGSGGHART